MVNTNLVPGSDCTDLFKSAYENRYTWEPGFRGYQGRCVFKDNRNTYEGSFELTKDFKSIIAGIEDKNIIDKISNQLWEVSIHRVRRPFEKVHGNNSFIVGDTDQFGMEVLVCGQNKGDKYRLRNNIITMVHRHIHGRLITIFNKNVFDTGHGYLSKEYTSQYKDPSTGNPSAAVINFNDKFIKLDRSDYWILGSRQVTSDKFMGNPSSYQSYTFLDLSQI